MKPHQYGWALAWLAGIAVGPALAAEPLTLAEAQRIAETRSMALPAQDAAAAAARERAVAAGQRPDPVLRFGLDNVPVEGSAQHLLTREPMTARSIGIVQALPDAAKRAARSRVFASEADAARAQRAVERRTARREAALAWFALRAEDQRLALIEAQRAEAALLRDAVDAVWRGGRGAQTEAFAARAALARLDDQRLAALGRRAQATATLQRWVGDAAGQPLAQAPPLGSTRLTEARLDDDPAIRLAGVREATAAAAVQLAREDRRADWSVDLRFAQRGPRFDNMVTIGLSLPLRWDLANRQDRELAARLAMQQQAQAQTEELTRERDAEVERWRQRWRSALARLDGYDRQLLPLAALQVQAALAAYRAGGGALKPVLDARVAEQALRLERVQIELDAAADWVRLETLLPAEEASR